MTVDVLSPPTVPEEEKETSRVSRERRRTAAVHTNWRMRRSRCTSSATAAMGTEVRRRTHAQTAYARSDPLLCFFDLLSQAIVTYAERGSKRVDTAMYPAAAHASDGHGGIACSTPLACCTSSGIGRRTTNVRTLLRPCVHCPTRHLACSEERRREEFPLRWVERRNETQLVRHEQTKPPVKRNREQHTKSVGFSATMRMRIAQRRKSLERVG